MQLIEECPLLIKEDQMRATKTLNVNPSEFLGVPARGFAAYSYFH